MNNSVPSKKSSHTLSSKSVPVSYIKPLFVELFITKIVPAKIDVTIAADRRPFCFVLVASWPFDLTCFVNVRTLTTVEKTKLPRKRICQGGNNKQRNKWEIASTGKINFWTFFFISKTKWFTYLLVFIFVSFLTLLSFCPSSSLELIILTNDLYWVILSNVFLNSGIWTVIGALIVSKDLNLLSTSKVLIILKNSWSRIVVS